MGELLDKITKLAVDANGGPDKKPAAAAPEAPLGPKPGTAYASPSDPSLAAVTKSDGSTGYVKLDDVAKVVAQGGHVATEGEVYKSQHPVAAAVGAVSVGALQGITGDYFVPAAAKLSEALGGDKEREDTIHAAKLAHEVYPSLYAGSEIGGALLPALVGDTAQAETTGEGLLARAVDRASTAAPRLLAEGAAFGAGHQLTEDTLGHHDVTAEKIAAAAEGGAVFNMILGGALHSGLGALGDVAASKLASRAAKAGEGEAYRAAHPGEPGEGGALDWIRGKAEEQAFKATGAKTEAIRKLGATGEEQAEEMRRLGRVGLDEGIVTAGASKEDMAERVAAKLEEKGAELGEMRKPLDQAAVRPSLQNVAKAFDEKVLDRLADTLGGGVERLKTPLGDTLHVAAHSEAAPALDLLEEMAKKAGDRPDFDTLYRFRRDLDNMLQKGGEYERFPTAPAKKGAEAIRALRGIVEDEYLRAGDEAAAQIGGDFTSKYRLTKETYSDLKTIESILAREVPREAANRAISLTDTIAAGSGMSTAIGAVLGGHPIGALAALAPLVNKTVRTYGNQMAAHVLDSASKLEAIQRAASHFDGLVERGVRGFLEGGARGGPSLARETQPVTAETAQKIREVGRSPEALRARVEASLDGAGTSKIAPKVSQALATTIVRSATYLATQAPREASPVGLSILPQPPRPPAASDMQRFSDIVAAVNDPLSVVEDLRRGHLNRDKVDAIRTCYPRLYEQIRQELARQAAEMRPDLTQQQEIALSILFQEPLTATMNPEVISAFQGTYAQGATPDTAKAGGQPKAMKPLHRESGAALSAFDKLEQNGP